MIYYEIKLNDAVQTEMHVSESGESALNFLDFSFLFRLS